VSDGSDQALLDRVATDVHSLEIVEESSAPRPAQFRPTGHTAWVRQQLDADAALRRDYTQAAGAHPHLSHHDLAAIVSHVEPLVSHVADAPFGRDADQTRRSYAGPLRVLDRFLDIPSSLRGPDPQHPRGRHSR